MTHSCLRYLALPLPLLLVVGCTTTSQQADPVRTDIQIRGQFEKAPITRTGQGPLVTLPARYCYAELRADDDNSIIASGYLGSDGTATASVNAGTKVYVELYAQYEVPGGTDFFMHGSVKNGAAADSYSSATLFNAIPDWSVSSATQVADTATVITATARTSNGHTEAGAFNIADQAVNFGSTIRDLEPTLRLPNLHLFWQSTGQASTGAASAAVDGSGKVLNQLSGRAIFQMSVRGRLNSSVEAGADQFNDGVLQQRLASMLFAPYSYPADGSAATAVIRCDTDSFARTDRGLQGESSTAFTTGFCDFLSAAVRKDPTIIDVDSTGLRTVTDLSSHTHPARVSNQGEFYSDAIATSLYGIWSHSLGGATPGLQALWNATLVGDPGAIMNAPLACYPTYLVGLKNRLTATAWTSALNELALEDMGDLTAASYFGDPTVSATQALWLTRTKPFTATGALTTYPAASAIYYDRDQAEAYRFVQASAGPLTATLMPLDGQDLFLELIGPTGVVAGSYDQRATPGKRTLSIANLAAGTYVVRVKVGYTTAAVTGGARYSLTVN